MENIIGHTLVREKLRDFVKNKNVSHAYIFEGPYGVGKYLVAKEFAKRIVCENKNGDICGVCEACKKTENSSDIYTLIPESDDIIKVEEIRDLLEMIPLKPVFSDSKVILIKNAENMKAPSQNALLKMLEEPPHFATIILITKDKYKLLNTIRSRCVEVRFNKLSNEEIKEYTKNMDVSDELVEYADGSIGKLQKLIDENYIDSSLELIKLIDKNDLLETNKALGELKKNDRFKNHIIEVIDYLMFWYHKNIKANDKDSIYKIDVFEETKQNLLKSANFDISLDSMMIKIWDKTRKGDTK